MADLSGIEVTSENQLKESAARPVQERRPALWGSCALCLAGDQCFDSVYCQGTNKTCGHPEHFDSIIEYLNVC